MEEKNTSLYPLDGQKSLFMGREFEKIVMGDF
jgi:hypothetical protein